MPGGLKKRTGRGRRPREGKLARSEIGHLRLDPELRYALELAARRHRLSFSSYLEQAAVESLQNIRLRKADGTVSSLAEQRQELWDADEVARFVKLGARFPDLINHREEVLWNLIKQNRYVCPDGSATSVNLPRLHQTWERFVAVADGARRSILPDENGSWEPFQPATNGPPKT